MFSITTLYVLYMWIKNGIKHAIKFNLYTQVKECHRIVVVGVRGGSQYNTFRDKKFLLSGCRTLQDFWDEEATLALIGSVLVRILRYFVLPSTFLKPSVLRLVSNIYCWGEAIDWDICTFYRKKKATLSFGSPFLMLWKKKKDRAMVAFTEIFLPLTWMDGYLIPYNASSVTILGASDKENVLFTQFPSCKNPVLCQSAHIFQCLQVTNNCQIRKLPERAMFGSIHALTWGASETTLQMTELPCSHDRL